MEVAPFGRRNETPPRVVSTDTGEASLWLLAFWKRILVASLDSSDSKKHIWKDIMGDIVVFVKAARG